MTRKLRTAVIGLGAIGPTHAGWCASVPESELRVVCDADAQRVRAVADRYGVDAATDYRAVVERDDVDAVLIATPTFLHAPMALAAVAAGKHIAIEKPLCLTLAEADELIDAVARAGVHAQYLENLCYSPAYRQAKEIVAAGGIGDVVFIRCTENAGGGVRAAQEVYAPRDSAVTGGEGAAFGAWSIDPEKAGGGALMSTACHQIMYLRWLLDRAPATRVYAELQRVASPDARIDDAAYLTIRYAGGQIAWVDSSMIGAFGTFDDRAEIQGTEGTILLDLYRSSGISVYSQSGYGRIGSSMFGSIPDADRNWSHPIPDERWSLGYAAELRAFLGAILADQPPELPLQDGRATLEIVLAGYESARRGGPIALEEIAA